MRTWACIVSILAAGLFAPPASAQTTSLARRNQAKEQTEEPGFAATDQWGNPTLERYSLIAVRIKPLRLQEKILEFGQELLDLTGQAALVDPHQTLAIGFALHYIQAHLSPKCLSPGDLASIVCEKVAKKGLCILSQEDDKRPFLALPRKLELAAGINRYRKLQVEFR